MIHWSERALKGLELLLRWYLVALMALVVILTFVQVVARYVMASPFTGTDNLARIVLAWMTFIGAAVATGQGKNIRIETFEKYMSPRVIKALGVVFDVVLIVLLAMLVIKGWQVTLIGSNQMIIATPFNYDVMYASLVAGSLIMLLYIVLRLLARLGVIPAQVAKRG